MHDGTFELKSKLRYGTEVIVSFPRSRAMEALPLTEPGEETAEEPEVPWRPSKGRRVS